jgi:hypothetical protein
MNETIIRKRFARLAPLYPYRNYNPVQPIKTKRPSFNDGTKGRRYSLVAIKTFPTHSFRAYSVKDIIRRKATLDFSKA